MTIIGIDPGKFKSVACTYDPRTRAAAYATVPTDPEARQHCDGWPGSGRPPCGLPRSACPRGRGPGTPDGDASGRWVAGADASGVSGSRRSVTRNRRR